MMMLGFISLHHQTVQISPWGMKGRSHELDLWLIQDAGKGIDKILKLV